VAIPHPLDGNDDHAVCGGLTVTNVLDRKALGQQGLYEPFVRVTDTNGTKIYEAHGRRYTIDTTSVTMALVADFCGDLDGDGVMDLVLTERTMGAHCCYTHYAVSMTRPAKRLLMWEKGDAGTGIWPVKAKPGSSWQLMSTVVVWPPFDAEAGEPSLSYATAPLLPIIFTLESGTYRARTFRFSDFLRKHRAEARQRCKSNPDCEISEIIEWGYALIIGDWPSVRPTIDTEPYILQALDRRAAATTKQLRRELGF
jgi:hypothetical protein